VDTTTQHADLRFYAGLRDFLSTDRRSGSVTRSFDVSGSVKDMIEACGVPHTEVALIVVDGGAVGFTYRVRDGDHIGVYPLPVTLEVDPGQLVSPPPLADPRFVLDGHLGRLARYLRLLGLDCAYDPEWPDAEIVAVGVEQRRIVLTRDVGLLMHAVLEHGYYVRSIEPVAQLDEVVRRYDLRGRVAPFTRCMVCNGSLVVVEKEMIVDRLEAGTVRAYDDFRQCGGCGRAFWKGAHYPHLRGIVDRFTTAPKSDDRGRPDV
jgi:uncharacterized protein with PIN domain